ncbi:hypothetical protein DB346_20770 [Verrucomicrobia bacterium LW23]|nr:hypothetical protein DB346_20770 [Verrucomicrobia bacterium LW23]
MRSYCLLQLHGHTCGVDLSAVKEVLPVQPLALVPLGPECLLGAINLRSEIVSVYALESVLQGDFVAEADDNGAPPATPVVSGQDDRFLILQYEDFTFGVRALRVDTVRLPDEAEPLDPRLPEVSLLHPPMEFEDHTFRVIELDHLVQRLRLIMTHCFSE